MNIKRITWMCIKHVIHMLAKDHPQMTVVVTWNNEVIHKRIKLHVLLLNCSHSGPFLPSPCPPPFARWLCSKCHQKVVSISLPFESGLNLWLPLGNRTQQKWCVSVLCPGLKRLVCFCSLSFISVMPWEPIRTSLLEGERPQGRVVPVVADKALDMWGQS